MDIYVLDSNFNSIGIIDEYESSIWDIKYFESGNFELYIQATVSNLAKLQRDYYLVRDKDIVNGCMYNVMVIETVSLETDLEDGDYLTVTGRDLKSLTDRRIVWAQTNLDSKVEYAVRRLITENVINPTDTARKMDGIILGAEKGYTETIRRQITRENLLESIVSILTTYGIGWNAYVDANNHIVYELVKGVDRTVNQSVYSRIEFSPDNDNLLNSNYKKDYSGYKNVALVAGEGEGNARKTTTVGAVSGMNRYEVYVDASGVSQNLDTEEAISDAEYLVLLAEEGIKTLEDSKYVESFEGEIETEAIYTYGTDYNLGDIVTVTNEYGVTANPRIIGVVECHNIEGVTTIPTFSNWIGDDM